MTTKRWLLLKAYGDFLSITLVVLLFFGHLFVPTPQVFFTPEYSGSDQWHQHYPYKDYLARQLKQFQLPLWNPNIAMGYPQLAEGQTGTFFLPNLFLFFLLPTWLAWNVSFVVTFWLCFMGTYLWLRAHHCSHSTSWLGGFWLSFGGFMVIHIIHLPLIQTFALLPWLLWLIKHYQTKPRLLTWWWLSFGVSQQWYTGHAQMAVINVVIIILYLAGTRLWTSKEKPRKLAWVAIGTAILWGTLMSSIQLLPSWELLQESTRSGGLSSELQFAYPYPLQALLTFLSPYFFGDPHQGTFLIPNAQTGLFWENIGYLGWIPLLGLLGIFFTRYKARYLWISLAGLMLLLMLGPQTPLSLLYQLPPLSYFRLPARFLGGFSLCLVLLAAKGLDYWKVRLTKNLASKKYSRMVTAIVCVISVLDLGYFAYTYHPTLPVAQVLQTPKMVAQIPASARLLSSGTQQQAWQHWVSQQGWEDVSALLAFKESLAANQNLLFDRINLNGYTALETQRYQLFFNAFSPQLADAAALTHLVSPEPLILPHLSLVHTQKSEQTGVPNFYVYRNQTALPRLRWVSNYFRADSLDQARAALGKISDATVILEATLDQVFTPLKQKEIALLKETPNTLELKTNTDQDALLVVADSYYPGWRATVDGTATTIYPANINLRAIVVPKGDHSVTFDYRPTSFYRGMVLSVVAICIWIAVGLRAYFTS